MPKTNLTERLIRPLTVERDTEYWDETVADLILRVLPSGRKTWYLRYYAGRTPEKRGRYRRLKIGRYPEYSIADARTAATDLRGQIARGEDPALEAERVRGSWTFRRLASEYLKRHARPKKRRWREDQRILEKDLLPELGDLKAEAIRKRDVIALLDSIVDRGAPVMANRTRAVLSRIYTFGISRDIIEHNPVFGTEPPGEEGRRDRVLTAEEIRTLWHGLAVEHPVMAAAFRLLLLTAQRSGNVLTMDSQQIDGEWWTIPRNLFKNHRPHRVFLSEPARRLVGEMSGRYGPDGYVLPSPRKPGGRMRDTALSHAARRICQRLETEKFTPHDLRRTATSHLTEAGVPRFVVERVLGHVDLTVTGRYDLYAYDREKREALTLWGARVENIIRHSDGS